MARAAHCADARAGRKDLPEVKKLNAGLPGAFYYIAKELSHGVGVTEKGI
jgi:hypothetical protein